jgi:hypothetical protein
MRKDTFFLLLDKVTLRDLKCGNKICAGEKLLIFIYVLCGQSNRSAQERFQHSGDSISKVIRHVLRAVLQLKNEYLCLPVNNQVPTQIRNNSKLFPYFKNCDGCFDGTHINAVSDSRTESESFRNRKGYISQNVLGAINFDMIYTFIHAGWEGSAHDGRVLSDALTKGFIIRDGKFWLADAGYPLSNWCLTPYRGVRYHHKEWKKGRSKPQSKEELFNLRHAQARNIIERGFGVTKKRFPILKNMPAYPYRIQIGFVFSCAVLHNFIRMHQSIPDEFDEWDEESEDTSNDAVDNEQHDAQAADWRDSIAQSMWTDYLAYTN